MQTKKKRAVLSVLLIASFMLVDSRALIVGDTTPGAAAVPKGDLMSVSADVFPTVAQL